MDGNSEAMICPTTTSSDQAVDVHDPLHNTLGWSWSPIKQEHYSQRTNSKCSWGLYRGLSTNNLSWKSSPTSGSTYNPRIRMSWGCVGPVSSSLLQPTGEACLKKTQSRIISKSMRRALNKKRRQLMSLKNTLHLARTSSPTVHSNASTRTHSDDGSSSQSTHRWPRSPSLLDSLEDCPSLISATSGNYSPTRAVEVFGNTVNKKSNSAPPALMTIFTSKKPAYGNQFRSRSVLDIFLQSLPDSSRNRHVVVDGMFRTENNKRCIQSPESEDAHWLSKDYSLSSDDESSSCVGRDLAKHDAALEFTDLVLSEESQDAENFGEKAGENNYERTEILSGGNSSCKTALIPNLNKALLHSDLPSQTIPGCNEVPQTTFTDTHSNSNLSADEGSNADSEKPLDTHEIASVLAQGPSKVLPKTTGTVKSMFQSTSPDSQTELAQADDTRPWSPSHVPFSSSPNGSLLWDPSPLPFLTPISSLSASHTLTAASPTYPAKNMSKSAAPTNLSFLGNSNEDDSSTNDFPSTIAEESWKIPCDSSSSSNDVSQSTSMNTESEDSNNNSHSGTKTSDSSDDGNSLWRLSLLGVNDPSVHEENEVESSLPVSPSLKGNELHCSPDDEISTRRTEISLSDDNQDKKSSKSHSITESSESSGDVNRFWRQSFIEVESPVIHKEYKAISIPLNISANSSSLSKERELACKTPDLVNSDMLHNQNQNKSNSDSGAETPEPSFADEKSLCRLSLKRNNALPLHWEAEERLTLHADDSLNRIELRSSSELESPVSNDYKKAYGKDVSIVGGSPKVEDLLLKNDVNEGSVSFTQNSSNIFADPLSREISEPKHGIKADCKVSGSDPQLLTCMGSDGSNSDSEGLNLSVSSVLNKRFVNESPVAEESTSQNVNRLRISVSLPQVEEKTASQPLSSVEYDTLVEEQDSSLSNAITSNITSEGQKVVSPISAEFGLSHSQDNSCSSSINEGSDNLIVMEKNYEDPEKEDSPTVTEKDLLSDSGASSTANLVTADKTEYLSTLKNQNMPSDCRHDSSLEQKEMSLLAETLLENHSSAKQNASYIFSEETLPVEDTLLRAQKQDMYLIKSQVKGYNDVQADRTNAELCDTVNPTSTSQGMAPISELTEEDQSMMMSDTDSNYGDDDCSSNLSTDSVDRSNSACAENSPLNESSSQTINTSGIKRTRSPSPESLAGRIIKRRAGVERTDQLHTSNADQFSVASYGGRLALNKQTCKIFAAQELTEITPEREHRLKAPKKSLSGILLGLLETASEEGIFTPKLIHQRKRHRTISTRASVKKLKRRKQNHHLQFINERRMEIFEVVKDGNMQKVQEFVQDVGPSVREEKTNCTLLHVATAQNQVDVVLFLLRLINPNVVDAEGQAPAHVAAKLGHTQVLRILMADEEFDHEKLDKNGRSFMNLLSVPLCDAVISQNKTRIQELIKLGADPDDIVGSLVKDHLPQDLEISTARQLATELNNENVLQLLPKKELQAPEKSTKAPNVVFSANDVDFVRAEGISYPKPMDFSVTPANEQYEGDDVYPMNSKPRGFVCILDYNNFRERQDLALDGSTKDVSNLVHVFSQMGYSGEVYSSLTGDDTKDVLLKVKRNEVLKEMGCLIIIVNSHGVGEDHFLTSDLKLMDFQKTCNLFKDSECPYMVNKPKMFIFNTCNGLYREAKRSRYMKPTSTRVTESLRDTICLYSSSKGFASYSYSDSGTPFTYALCDTLAKHSHNKEINDLFREFMKEYGKSLPVTLPEMRNIGFCNKFFFNPVKP